MGQAIFFFDYVRFREEVQELVELADRKNYQEVIARAKQIASHIHPEEWILHDMGTNLRWFIENENTDPRFLSECVGFSFLIMLSKYLKTIDTLSRPSFPLIVQLVTKLGWSERDSVALGHGMATTSLLKPSLVTDTLLRPGTKDSPEWFDPQYYWWWVRPSHAFYTGWWNQELLIELSNKLSLARESINGIKFIDQEHFRYFTESLTLINGARKRGVGLFQIIAQ